jgi:hypothetical protein
MGEVTPLDRGGKGGGRRDPPDLLWLRRQALTVVERLPEKPEDAMLVLQFAIELVRYISAGLPPT